jgi:hypothetical protein
MKGKWLLIAALVEFGMGCAASKGFNRGEMDSALRSGNPTFVSSNLTVEEIEKLKPQINLPVKLAVAPPTVTMRYSRGGDDPDSWSSEEIAEIDSWEEPLKKAGVVSELILLPPMLVDQCRYDDPGCGVRAKRAAAARVQADALLTIRLATAVDEYTNPSSLFDLTILGMWVVPGHHRDALTIAEGVMIDNRNEYLYVIARGEGQENLVRPFAYADTWKAVRPSRLEALRSFGREFTKQASQLRTK